MDREPDLFEMDLVAPAKVNLGLAVRHERESGRHPLSTIIQAVSLCDEIQVRAVPDSRDPGVTVEMESVHGFVEDPMPMEENLVFRAAMAFHERIGEPLSHRVSFSVLKRIPMRSGLGGGSSDCAAAIVAMARLHGLDPKGPEAVDVARRLGSDIAFFLEGGCALYGGFGDIFVQRLATLEAEFVIARPEGGLPTPEVYARFDELAAGSDAPAASGAADVSAESISMRRMEQLLAVGDSVSNPVGKPMSKIRDSHASPGGASAARAVASILVNSLQPPACDLMPEISSMLDELSVCEGVWGSALSGSGSAVFAICSDPRCASEAASRMRDLGWWSVTCTGISFGASSANRTTCP